MKGQLTIDIPKDCYECDLPDYYDSYCRYANIYADHTEEGKRPPECPIRPLGKICPGDIVTVPERPNVKHVVTEVGKYGFCELVPIDEGGRLIGTVEECEKVEES